MASPATDISPASTCPDCLTGNLSWLLWRASYALATEMTVALAEVGISPRDHCVLGAAVLGEFTQTELAHTVGLDKTTMVVTVDELEEAGLAERRPAPHDRRARVIAVTPAGREALERANAVMNALQDDVLSGLSTAERDALQGALRQLLDDRLSHPVQCDKPVRRRAPRG